MSDFTRGQVRDTLTFVRVNARFMYGWKTVDLAARTGISAADIKGQLGHMTPAEALAGANRLMVTGANSPKPARVVKRDRTAPISQPGSTSTYIAFDKLAAATTAGWTLAKGARGVRLTASVDGRRSMTAVAELSNGLLYAFPLNRVDFERAGAALGLQAAAQITTLIERQSLVTGSRSKPGRASIEDGGGVFSTFYSTDAQDAVVAAGYNLETEEFIEFAAAGGAV
ncbi:MULTISPECIES: hypothetical protein [Cyanophyceae]|uniref:hypothetical protein n=1 Tax=Cyanophyceae TaxID=3028117 RepID=UPI001687818F|nr:MULTISPECIES: hypothetical protein [Cyanophyceae]MBD1917167.1 hypothetical protein [Phormidium sp. FACHB-77]MBD2030698.1 hypothetical protein [Phormidium sp. FACHB-322]MBD2050194.1 hypothetical protein [Leptolyngbya sp. FACHB-60]